MVIDNKTLMLVTRKAFTDFSNNPSISKLIRCDECLDELRRNKVPFDFSYQQESMRWVIRQEKFKIDPYARSVMDEMICGMSLVNRIEKEENLFSWSYSSPGVIKTGVIKNSEFEKIKKMYEDWQPWPEHFIISKPAPRIKKIIVNNQTTIVMWYDGTKTIVRPTANDKFDLDAAVCAAIAKKLYGTNSALKRDIKKKVVYQENKKKKEEG